MSVKIEQIRLPKFIHCENEPKTGDLIHDNRQFIYCPEFLSLIEIIPLNDYQIQYDMNMIQKTFIYQSKYFNEEEEFLLVFVQNNVGLVNQSREIEYLQNNQSPITTDQLLKEAWEYYLNYLIKTDNELH